MISHTQKSYTQLIGDVQLRFKDIESCIDLSQKQQLIKGGFVLLDVFQDSLQSVGDLYTANRLQKQLESARNRMKMLARRTQTELSIMNRISRASITIPNTQQQFAYDPRMSVEQNMVRSILYQQIRESELLISDQEVNQLARKMENNLEVMKEVANLIDEQGNQLDQVETNIEHTNSNVKQARNLMLKANQHYGGAEVLFDNQGNICFVDGQDFREHNSVDSEPVKNEVHMNPKDPSSLSKIRVHMKDSFKGFGFSIKKAFWKVFRKAK